MSRFLSRNRDSLFWRFRNPPSSRGNSRNEKRLEESGRSWRPSSFPSRAASIETHESLNLNRHSSSLHAGASPPPQQQNQCLKQLVFRLSVVWWRRMMICKSAEHKDYSGVWKRVRGGLSGRGTQFVDIKWQGFSSRKNPVASTSLV